MGPLGICFRTGLWHWEFTVQWSQLKQPKLSVGTYKVISSIIPLGCPHPREDWSSPTMPTYLLRRLLKKTVFWNSWQYLQVPNSNATADCWLCIKPWSSCYVSIATLFSQGNQPSDIRKLIVDELKSQQCPWAKRSLSLMQELKGKGTCFHSE